MKSLEEIRIECKAAGELFEDEDFPASHASIDSTETSLLGSDCIWKRPTEICENPQFLVEGSSRFDLAQGELGDCWFIAAAAVLATKKELFEQVVPIHQDFEHQYAGVFHFNIWRFGEWVDVVVDDRLPVNEDGQLMFGRNRSQANEFWGPLLEKAYAKLNGCYLAIKAGHIRDALVDFTGGLSESFNLRNPDDLPADLLNRVQKSFKEGSLLGAEIWGNSGSTTEEKLSNGLFRGHAYSITRIVEARVQGWTVKLIRLHNPWGEKEWKGPWSDGSSEWKSLSNEEKARVGLTFQDDGEFWMDFEEFIKNFHNLNIVHLGPQTFSRLELPAESVQWREVMYHGKWVKGVNAGGSGILSSHSDLYYKNPRYYITLKHPDEDDPINLGECTCIISMMQTMYQKRKKYRLHKRVIIGFDVYQVKGSVDPEALKHPDDFVDETKLKKQFNQRTLIRETTCKLSLDPGTYCIIPNTLKPNQEAGFLLRIYTYSKIDTKVVTEKTKPLPKKATTPVKPVGKVPAETFWQYAGDDKVVDARDLRDLLNELSRAELGETLAFSVEACRTLISISDDDKSGTLDFDQLAKLWDEIIFWKKVFQKFDKDKSGCIETYELSTAFRELGFSLSFETMSTLAIRFGGKERTLFFEDFVLCLSKTVTMYVAFKEYSTSSTDEAVINLEEWMKTTLYY